MKAPDTIRPILPERMPLFKILDPEDEALYAYFRTTLVDDRIEGPAESVGKMALNDQEMIRLGRNLYYKKYTCKAHHQINLKGGLIGPDLTKVGRRLRPEWIGGI